MNTTLEEIALEVGKETALWVSDGLLIEFARRLVARLGAQEPVAEFTLRQYGTDPWAKFWAGKVPANFGQLVYHKFKLGDKVKLFAAPQLPQREGWQWVPSGDTDTAKEIIHSAFNEAMLVQAGEIGPLSLRQRNAVFATVWSCVSAMLAPAPKPEDMK